MFCGVLGFPRSAGFLGLLKHPIVQLFFLTLQIGLLAMVPSSQPHNLTAANNKIASIEAQIAQLQTQLVAAKKERNQFTPLYRLPNEIISRILFYVQAPRLRETPSYGHAPGLYNFTYDQKWEKAILTCSHIYEISMLTPELWDHVDLSWPLRRLNRHLRRTRAVNLSLQVAKSDHEAHFDETLACACLARSHAAKLWLGDLKAHDVQAISRMEIGSAPSMSILHMVLHRKHEDSLQMLRLFPALTELFIHDAILTQPLEIRLPLLTVLRMESIHADDLCRPMISLLQHTPRLTELWFEGFQDDTPALLPYPAATHDLALPYLRKLSLSGPTRMVQSILGAISLQTHSLEDIVVDAHQSNISFDPYVFGDLVQEVVTRWESMSSLGLPPAEWLFNAYASRSWLKIESPSGTAPRIKFDVIHDDDQISIYRPQVLNIAIVRVELMFPRGMISSEWTAWLDDKIGRYTHAGTDLILHLKFTECTQGIPELEDWIAQQTLHGRSVQSIMFMDCQKGPTWTQYDELKKSELVPQVEWNSSEPDWTFDFT
jgi:hypothetical protein